jgi:hypothetical protein
MNITVIKRNGKKEPLTIEKWQTQIAKVVASYSGFLDAGTSYAQVMQDAAKALGGTPCPTLLAALAAVHATKYKCNFTWNKSGDAVFYNGKESTRESRNDPARKSWGRNVMVWFKAEKPRTPQSHGRITREARELGMGFLSNFEGKDRAAQVRAAIALLKSLA